MLHRDRSGDAGPTPRGSTGTARAMAGKDGRNYESTLRRWLSLDPSEPRPIIDLNRIVGRLSKFSRAEIKKSRRRIHRAAGPPGDRQAVIAHLSLLAGAKKLLLPTSEETVAFPAGVVVAGLLVPLVRQIAAWLIHAQSAPVAA